MFGAIMGEEPETPPTGVKAGPLLGSVGNEALFWIATSGAIDGVRLGVK